MLKHENPNIEIINKNLWAVRFSLIPFIPQISYKPDLWNEGDRGFLVTNVCIVQRSAA